MYFILPGYLICRPNTNNW